jgi:hypothetical protein
MKEDAVLMILSIGSNPNILFLPINLTNIRLHVKKVEKQEEDGQPSTNDPSIADDPKVSLKDNIVNMERKKGRNKRKEGIKGRKE